MTTPMANNGSRGDSATRVLVVEDHSLLAQSLVVALNIVGLEHTEVVEELSPSGVLAHAARFRPDVVLLDLHLGPGFSGLQLVEPLAKRGARVLVMTADQDRTALARALKAGAAGLFSKCQPFDELIQLIDDAARGHTTLEPWARAELLASLHEEDSDQTATTTQRLSTLTRREGEVLNGLLLGHNADQIANEQVVSLATVRSHIQSILRKLGVNSQLAAVVLAQRAGWSVGSDRPSARQ